MEDVGPAAFQYAADKTSSWLLAQYATGYGGIKMFGGVDDQIEKCLCILDSWFGLLHKQTKH